MGDVLIYEASVEYKKYEAIASYGPWEERVYPSSIDISIQADSHYVYSGYTIDSRGRFALSYKGLMSSKWYSGVRQAYTTIPPKKGMDGDFGNPIYYFDFNTYKALKKIELVRSIAGYNRGSYIETIKAKDGTYPENGVQDGFWYEKVIK